MQFTKLKSLISNYGIESFISGLENVPVKPVAPKEISGTRLEVKGFVDPFFMAGLKRDGLVQFTAKELDSSQNVIQLTHQAFSVSPAQADEIVMEDFGAVIVHERHFHLLSKQELQKREEYIKLCAEYDRFEAEYRRVDDLIRDRAYQEATE